MDGEILLQLLYASVRAYKDQPPRKAGYRSEFITCEGEDVQCRIWYGKGEAWVAFRGTDSVRDVLLDLKIRKVSAKNLCPLNGAKVHRGFLQAYSCGNFRYELYRRLRDSGAQKIYFTGHSLGGAMATLAALDFRNRESRPEIWLITFGCPRIGNRTFCRYFDQKILEAVYVQNGNDIVTKLPPAMLGYARPGVVYRVGRPRIPGIISFKEHWQKAYFGRLLPICLE